MGLVEVVLAESSGDFAFDLRDPSWRETKRPGDFLGLHRVMSGHPEGHVENVSFEGGQFFGKILEESSTVLVLGGLPHILAFDRSHVSSSP